MECPNCKGRGEMYGYGCPGFKPIAIKCDICKGSGQLPDTVEYDPERGNGQKRRRIEENITLRELARRMGIPTSQLSQQERGFFPK